jgi:Na+-driven multidrug efflux pump
LSLFISCKKDLKEAWFFPDKESISFMWSYLKLAIPSMIMISLDTWGLEIITFMSGYLSTNELAA